MQTLLGHIFFHVGQYGKAELYLRRATDMINLDAAKEKGTSTLSLVLLGWSMCMQGSWMEGESAFSVAHSLDLSCVDAVFGLGCCSMNYGNFDTAATRFAAGLALEGQHPGCLEGRAIARYRSGRLQEAVSDLTLALRSCQSQSSEAKAKSGRGKSSLIVSDLTYARWKRTKGLLHILLEDYSIAEQDMASSLEFEPNSAQAHTWKAFLRMRRGLWSKSIDMLKLSLKIVSNDLNALALLAICNFKLNNWASVIELTQLYAREARIKLNQKAIDFKQIQQDQHGCSAEGIDGGSVAGTIGDLNDLIEQIKVAHELETNGQLQKRISNLTEMFLGETTAVTNNDVADFVPGLRIHEVMAHNRQIPPITVCEKVDLMNDRWKRVADRKIVAFIPDNLAMMHLEALGHMKMNKEALQFLENYSQMKNLSGEPIPNGMLLLMARFQIDKARTSDPAKCGPTILTARKYLLVLLHQDPYNIAAHLCMAYLWCHENMLDQAEYHIMAVLHMDAKCTDALQLRAQFNASLGNLYAAESDISQACRINPEDANLFITYASIKKLIPYSDNQVSVNLSEALGYQLSEADIIASALEIDPNQRNVLMYIGVSLLEDTRFQDAADIFSKCLSLYPYDAVAYMNRGVAFSCLQKFTEAREDFQACMRLNPYNSDVLLNFAFLEDTCQKSGLAQRLLEKAADVSPLDADVHDVRANFYAKSGRARKGRLAAQTAHWLRSDSFDQAKTMGLRFWNFMMDRENGSATCDNMGIYGINIISLTLIATARPLSMRPEKDKKNDKDKDRNRSKVALSFTSNTAENKGANADGLKAPEAKAAGGMTGKSPRTKFIQSVPMHDGIGRNYSNNPSSATVIPKPPKIKDARESK
jgi:tetratricopeptide (TPR) repeat protein